jgi:hypothetical protein
MMGLQELELGLGGGLYAFFDFGFTWWHTGARGSA